MRNITKFLMLGMSLALVSCGSSTKKDEAPKFTHERIKKEIRKGETSQADAIHLLGNPDTIYKNQDDNEVWTYSQQTYDPESKALGGGVVLYGLTGTASKEAESYDVVIEWNKQNIVRNFTVLTQDL